MQIKDYAITDYTDKQFRELREIARKQGLEIYSSELESSYPATLKGFLRVNVSTYAWGSFINNYEDTQITATEFLRQYKLQGVVVTVFSQEEWDTTVQAFLDAGYSWWVLGDRSSMSHLFTGVPVTVGNDHSKPFRIQYNFGEEILDDLNTQYFSFEEFKYQFIKKDTSVTEEESEWSTLGELFEKYGPDTQVVIKDHGEVTMKFSSQAQVAVIDHNSADFIGIYDYKHLAKKVVRYRYQWLVKNLETGLQEVTRDRHLSKDSVKAILPAWYEAVRTIEETKQEVED